MKREQVIVILVLFVMFLINCESLTNSNNKEEDALAKMAGNNEYVIIPGDPYDGGMGYDVKNISTDDVEKVGGVVELEGRVYLPQMSSIPSYNNKVIKGVFITDTTYYYKTTGTIFRVTEHVRDTSLGYYGQ